MFQIRDLANKNWNYLREDYDASTSLPQHFGLKRQDETQFTLHILDYSYHELPNQREGQGFAC